MDNRQFFIAIDFHLNVDNISISYFKIFQNILHSVNLILHMLFVTHTPGHCLDLVITQRDDQFNIKRTMLFGSYRSDVQAKSGPQKKRTQIENNNDKKSILMHSDRILSLKGWILIKTIPSKNDIVNVFNTPSRATCTDPVQARFYRTRVVHGLMRI